MGQWLRQKGLRSEHLVLWEKEVNEAMSNGNIKSNKTKLAKANKKIKELEKELRKKDKALAEVSALLKLKKKADLLWGEEEES